MLCRWRRSASARTFDRHLSTALNENVLFSYRLGPRKVEVRKATCIVTEPPVEKADALINPAVLPERWAQVAAGTGWATGGTTESVDKLVTDIGGWRMRLELQLRQRQRKWLLRAHALTAKGMLTTSGPQTLFGSGVSTVDTAIAVTQGHGLANYSRVVHATPPAYGSSDTLIVHHHDGDGAKAQLLSSLRRCVVIATHSHVDGICEITSNQQRSRALQGPRRFDLRGEEEIRFLEDRYKVRISVYSSEGQLVRTSTAPEAGQLVSVMNMGDDVYRYILDVDSVQRNQGLSAGWVDKMETYYRLSFQAAFRPGVDIGSRRASEDLLEVPKNTVVILPLVGPGACGAPVDASARAMARSALMWLRSGVDTLKHPGAAADAKKTLAADDENAPWTLIIADKRGADAVASLLKAAVERAEKKQGGDQHALVVPGDEWREYMSRMKQWH